MQKYSQELRDRIKTVTNKRARFVLDQIVKNGSVTTEQISAAGYDHPPRAAQDVRDLGFPLRRIKEKHSNGRTIASYILDETSINTRKSGRLAIPKKLRQELIEIAGGRCQLCGATQNLQIDHRVPFEVAGESLSTEKIPYQVLCGSCNRKKSWQCEHCQNFLATKAIEICRSCYWANPLGYTHVAMEPQRRSEVVWKGTEVIEFDELRQLAEEKGTTTEALIKAVIKKSQVK